MNKLIRKADSDWKSQNSQSSIKNWWMSRKKGRHLSFEERNENSQEVFYQFSSGSNDNIEQADQGADSPKNRRRNSNNPTNGTNSADFITTKNNNKRSSAPSSSNNNNSSSGASSSNQINLAINFGDESSTSNGSSSSSNLKLQNSSSSRICLTGSSNSNNENLDLHSSLQSSSNSLCRMSSAPPNQRSSLVLSTDSSHSLYEDDSSFNIADDIELLENEWQNYISFLSLQFGRIDTGISNKYAGSIFFESVESLRNVNMKNLSSSFRSLTNGLKLLINLYESGMSKMDLIQMAIVLSDNKELLRFYIIINAFAMTNSSFHKLCTEEEIFAWVKFESSLLKIVSAESGSKLGKLFFRIQNKLLR